MPNARLPDMNDFARHIEENDVNGAVLFEGVDASFLREDCGIKSLGQRSAVAHCIRKLKARSATLSKDGEAKTPQTPVSNAATPAVLPDAEQEIATASVPVFDNASTKRAGEVQVEDSSGRKRRRLDLSQPTALEPVLQLQPPPPSASFFGDSRLTVDDIFFGNTKMGQEIRSAETPCEMSSNPSSRLDNPEPNAPSDGDDSQELQESDTCFQFQASGKLAGESAYVYRQVRRFLSLDVAESCLDAGSEGNSIKRISRHGRDAIAILPYDEKLLQGDKAQSALVVQTSREDNNRCIAKRENVAFLDSGFDYDSLEIEGLRGGSNGGEWDFLAAKHKSTDSDELLPEYGASDTEGSLASLQEEMQKQDEEDHDDKKKRKLVGASLDSVIDGALAGIATAWNDEKLPRHEEKRAWTVWKKTRQSRLIRDSLIDGAQHLIRQLEHRVQKYREEMHRQEWRNDNEVIEQCRAMEMTIENIEEQRWHINVWQRKKEPHHTIRHGQRNGAAGSHSGNTGNPQKLPHIHPSDRLSVEPDTPMADAEDDVDDFHSAQGELQEAVQDDHEDASDEASEQDEDMGFLDDSASPVADPPDEVQDVDMTELPAESDHSDFEPDMSSPSNKARQSKARRNESQLTDTGVGTESQTLASPSSYSLRRPKQESRTPLKLSKSMNTSSEPIEISSDSTPGKAKPIKKKKKASPNRYNARPEDATAEEVESWNFEDLKFNDDRKRILIKLLAMLDAQERHAIWNKMKGLRRPEFAKQVLAMLNVLRQDFSGADQDKIMVLSTKLFLAYQFSRPDICSRDTCIDVDFAKALQDAAGVSMFCDVLDYSLAQGNLFKKPKSIPKLVPSKSTSSREPTEVIDLADSSGEDDERLAGTPRKRQFKKVKLNANAEQSQAAAFHRQQKFKEMRSQGSNSQELRAMIPGNASKSAVAINPLASPDNGEDYICIDENIAPKLKEHQIEGIQFMWRELTASGEDGGQGCILAHTMGLGKTLQTIATLVALNEATQSKNPRVYEQVPEHLHPSDIDERQLRMLIILPAALVQNWRREIQTWASHVFTNIFSVEAGARPDQIIDELADWYKVGGPLLMTYGLFQKYVDWRDPEAETKRSLQSKLAPFGPQLDEYLIEGPEIVVADEVHNLKNPKAKVTQAAKSIHTESRIGLTGTPMSNDVDEIYSLVSFAAPNYLGEKKWFNQTYSNPIKEGNRKDSTANEVRKMLKKLAVLRNQIEPKVHRADITALRGSLKTKLEFVIMLPLSDIQRTVYKKYLAALNQDESNLNGTVSQTRIFAWLSALTLLMNHPLAFKRKLLEPPKKTNKTKKAPRRDSTPSVSDSGTGTPAAENELDPEDLDMDEAIQSLAFSNEVKQDMIAGIDDELQSEDSKKMSLLLLILRLAKKCDDKVLVFSGSIPTLNYVEELLQNRGHLCGRIDGSVSIPKRQSIINAFHNGETNVMLMSTKAGVGLNIQGANRVILLDFGFNPSHEEQAVGRAYRIGQEKPVFVYRLIIGGTFEDNIYDKQMFKTSLTSRVVDKKNPRRIAFGTAGDWLYEPKETPQEDLGQWLGNDPDVLHKILKKQCKDPTYPGPRIRKLTTIETLQEDAADEPLNEEEQREVKEELAMRRMVRQNEKQAKAGLTASQTAMPPPTILPARPANGKPSMMVKWKTNQAQQQPHGLPTVIKQHNLPGTMPPMSPRANGQAGLQQLQGTSPARPSSTSPHLQTHGLPSASHRFR